MDIMVISIAWLLSIAGIVGCIVPIIPGPIVSYLGLLCMLFSKSPPSALSLIVFGSVVAIATVLDFIVPSIGAKRFKCSRIGLVGCTIGTIIGIYFFPLGLLLGPFVGAFVGELIAHKRINEAALGGLGAFLGFLCGMLMKLLVCVAMAVYLVKIMW